jgi:RNase P protein component
MVRRIFRETFRLNGEIFAPNRDYLLIALRGICSKSNGEIVDAIVAAAKKCLSRKNTGGNS